MWFFIIVSKSNKKQNKKQNQSRFTEPRVNNRFLGDYFLLQILCTSVCSSRTEYEGINQNKLQCVFMVLEQHVILCNIVAQRCVFYCLDNNEGYKLEIVGQFWCF